MPNGMFLLLRGFVRLLCLCCFLSNAGKQAWQSRCLAEHSTGRSWPTVRPALFRAAGESARRVRKTIGTQDAHGPVISIAAQARRPSVLGDGSLVDARPRQQTPDCTFSHAGGTHLWPPGLGGWRIKAHSLMRSFVPSADCSASCSRRPIFSASSSKMMPMPARFTPRSIRSDICFSRAKSSAWYLRVPPLVRAGVIKPRTS